MNGLVAAMVVVLSFGKPVGAARLMFLCFRLHVIACLCVIAWKYSSSMVLDHARMRALYTGDPR